MTDTTGVAQRTINDSMTEKGQLTIFAQLPGAKPGQPWNNVQHFEMLSYKSMRAANRLGSVAETFEPQGVNTYSVLREGEDHSSPATRGRLCNPNHDRNKQPHRWG